MRKHLTIIWIVLAFVGCSSNDSENKTNLTVRESGITKEYNKEGILIKKTEPSDFKTRFYELKENGLKTWKTVYHTIWVNNYLPNPYIEYVENIPKENLTFSSYSGDSLLFYCEQTGHPEEHVATYKTEGNPIILGERSENDSVIFQSFYVSTPIFFDSTTVSTFVDSNGIYKKRVSSRKLNGLAAVVQFDKNEFDNQLLEVKVYYHDAIKPEVFSKPISIK